MAPFKVDAASSLYFTLKWHFVLKPEEQTSLVARRWNKE